MSCQCTMQVFLCYGTRRLLHPTHVFNAHHPSLRDRELSRNSGIYSTYRRLRRLLLTSEGKANSRIVTLQLACDMTNVYLIILPFRLLYATVCHSATYNTKYDLHRGTPAWVLDKPAQNAAACIPMQTNQWYNLLAPPSTDYKRKLNTRPAHVASLDVILLNLCFDHFVALQLSRLPEAKHFGNLRLLVENQHIEAIQLILPLGIPGGMA